MSRKLAPALTVMVLLALNSDGAAATPREAPRTPLLPTSSWTADIPDWKMPWSWTFAADADHVFLLGVPPPGEARGGPNAVAVLPTSCAQPSCAPSWVARDAHSGVTHEIVLSPESDQLLLAGDTLTALPLSSCGDPCVPNWHSAGPSSGFANPMVAGTTVVAFKRNSHSWRALGYPLACAGECEPLWTSRRLGETLQHGLDPVVSGDFVYTRVDETVYGFDAACTPVHGLCDPVFSRSFPLEGRGELLGSAVVVGDALYMRQRDAGRGVALSAWPQTCGASCVPWWKKGLDLAQPAMTPLGGHLFVSGRHAYDGKIGKIVAFATGCAEGDLACRSPLWQADTPGPAGRIYDAGTGGVMATWRTGWERHVSRFELDCATGGGTCSPTESVSLGETEEMWQDDYEGTLYAAVDLQVSAVRCEPGCSVVWSSAIDRPARRLIAEEQGVFVDISGPIVPYSLNWIAAMVAFT